MLAGNRTDLQELEEEEGKDVEQYEGLIQYTVFFASFFDAKMEYQKRRKSIWMIWKILRIYGNDSIGKDCFAKLACDKSAFLS